MKLTRLVAAYVTVALFAGIPLFAGRLCAEETPDLTVTPSFQFESPVRLKAGSDFIDTGKNIGHAGPLVTDLNADGKPDLLVGNFRGHFQVYMNEGTRAEPSYVDKGLLEAGGETAKIPNW